MADPADTVAGDLGHLRNHGAARLRGYVRDVATVETLPLVQNKPTVSTLADPLLRVYTSSSFDHWIDVPKSKVRYQTLPRESDEQRILVWVDADAVVTRCQATLAGNVAASMEIGGDPSTYPGGSGP